MSKEVRRSMSKEERDPCEDCPFADTSCPGGAWCTWYDI